VCLESPTNYLLLKFKRRKTMFEFQKEVDGDSKRSNYDRTFEVH